MSDNREMPETQQSNSNGANVMTTVPMTVREPMVRPPEPLKVSENRDNLPAAWKIWKQMWQHYTVVTEMENSSRNDNQKKSFFLCILGMEALQVYNGCDPDENDKVNDIIRKLDVYILGEVNETMERYKFNTRNQRKDESIDCYVASLKMIVKSCNFCDCISLKDSLIRDRLVLGVYDSNTQARLLQERALTLKNCIDICRSFKNATSELKVLAKHENSTSEVYKLKKSHKPKCFGEKKLCNFCGFKHILKNKESCPAWGKSCDLCKLKNHFANCCKTKLKNKNRLHAVNYDYDSSETETVSVVRNNSGGIYAKLKIEKTGELVQFQIDSGATVNVIPANLAPNGLEESSCTLKMYNKTNIQPVGKCQIVIRNPVNRKKYRVEFQVVSGNLNPLISRRAAEQMKLITVNYYNFLHSVDRTENLINSKVFDGKLGDLPGDVKLHCEDNVKPVQCPVRRIPHSLKKTVKQELDDLEQKGVLIPVSEPTEWLLLLSTHSHGPC